MFIIFGQRAVRTPVGFVADVCPHCRKVTAFRISRVSRVPHVYFIKLGSGQDLGHERQCLACQARLAADTRRYAFVRPSNIGLDDLRAITFPNLDEFYASQRVIAEKVAMAPASLSADERAMALQQPFAKLAPEVQTKLASLILDRTLGMALIAWIASLALAFSIARFLPDSETLAQVIGVLFLVGLVSVLIVGAGGGRRYISRVILPAIADAVRPLRPSEEEIGRILLEFKRRKLTIGRRVGLNHLMRQINVEGAPQSSDAQ